MILIDSSVLLDISSNDPDWFEWSSSMLASCADRSLLCINPIVYAEASVRFSTPSEFDDAWPPESLVRESLPYTAAFLAGKAHSAYRRRGGRRSLTLPDFFIGAHALVAGHKILTRDPRRFRQYFPDVELIAP
jgi:predicted nucleic acid-binding protein